MKTYIYSIVYFLLFSGIVQAQRTYRVNFEENGFKGYAELKVDLFINGDFSSVTYNIKSSSKVVISSYKNGKYNLLLAKNGINFPKTIQVASTMDGNLFEITAQAFFYTTPQKTTIKAYGDPHDYLHVDNSTGIAAFDAHFSQNNRDYLKKYYEEHNVNLWRLTGQLGNFSVQRVYFEGFDDEVEKIIRDFEKEEQAKKEAEQQQQSNDSDNPYAQGKVSSYPNSNRNTLNSGNQASNTNGYSSQKTKNNTTASTNRYNSYNNFTINQRNAAIEKQRLENEKKIAAMQQRIKAQKMAQERMERGVQQAESGLNDMVNSFSSGATERGGLLQGSEQFINGVAQSTGSVGATVVAGLAAAGASMWSAYQQDKARQEAEDRAAEERRRIQEEQEALERQRQAELERQRQAAFNMLINQRYELLGMFNKQDKIPLSTSRVESDIIYYFIYATNPETLGKKETVVYVSNVFAIKRYNDGTWPYQSIIDKEIAILTPYEETMHGYYLDAGSAESMRSGFVNGFHANEGVLVRKIDYRESSMNTVKNNNQSSQIDGGGLGVSLDLKSDDNSKSKTTKNAVQSGQKGNGLGVPLDVDF